MSNVVNRWVAGIPRLAAGLAVVVVLGACQDRDLLAPIPQDRGIPKPNKPLSDGLAVAGRVDRNAAGEILGGLDIGTIRHSAISFHGVAHDLGTTDNSVSTISHPSAINNRGQVVGNEYVAGRFSAGFLWTPDVANGTTGKMRRLRETPHGPAHAADINDAGEIVGYTASAIVLWIGKDVVELPEPMAGAPASATSINQFGQAGGMVTDSTGVTHTYLWTPDAAGGTTGSYVLLDVPGVAGEFLVGLNDFGQVALNGTDGVARVWTPASPNGITGSFVSLRRPYGPFTLAGINNRGDAVGTGDGPSDLYCGTTTGIYLWRPSAPNGSSGVVLTVTTDIGNPFWSPVTGGEPQGYCSAAVQFMSEEENGLVQVFGHVETYYGDEDRSWTLSGLDVPTVWGVIDVYNTAIEDESVHFDGTGTNPYAAFLTYRWDFGDGGSDTGAPVSHKFPDNGVYTVRLTVSDSAGQTNSTSTTITVANKAPRGFLAVSPTSLDEGASYSVSMSQVSDAPGDLATLQLSLDCGDGRGYQAVAVTNALTCSAPNEEMRTARARIADKDGAVSEYAQQVTIANVAPAVTILSAVGSSSDKAAYTISFSFVDAGVLDRWSYTIDWGDGTSTAPTSVAVQGGTVTASHQYPAIKKGGGNIKLTYTVTVRVTDNAGAVGSASRSVVVAQGSGGK